MAPGTPKAGRKRKQMPPKNGVETDVVLAKAKSDLRGNKTPRIEEEAQTGGGRGILPPSSPSTSGASMTATSGGDQRSLPPVWERKEAPDGKEPLLAEPGLQNYESITAEEIFIVHGSDNEEEIRKKEKEREMEEKGREMEVEE